MALYLNEDQTMLRDTARPFIADAAPVKHMRGLREDATGFSRDLWKQFAEMGFTGIMVPEAHGGMGMGHVEAGIVLEEIGRNLTPSPFLTTAVAAVEALKASGRLSEEWLPKIASGDAIVALAIDDSAKHRPEATAMRAERYAMLDALRDMVVVLSDDSSAGLVELGRGKGSDILEHPLNAVVWLAQALAQEGLAMKPGQLISLGSFSPLLPPKAGLKVRVTYSGLAGAQPVSVQFK